MTTGNKNVLLLPIFIMTAMLMGFAMMGCGSDKGGSAPDGSTITITPTDLTITDKGPTQVWATEYFTIRVYDANGLTLNKVKLNIAFSFAFPDPAGVVQLYDNDVPVNSPYDNAYTDEFGVYNLRFDYVRGAGASYDSTLQIRSGTAYAETGFSVAGQ